MNIFGEYQNMCNMQKYYDIYKEINELSPEDTLQLIKEAPSKEERDFYELIGNFLLQQKQKKVIERNLF